uniref:p25-alpha-domain-containing protein n=1 Tax=Tetraselmis sp. GSL018 TaxID=582737 RepID=A0A061S832_9CHLO
MATERARTRRPTVNLPLPHIDPSPLVSPEFQSSHNSTNSFLSILTEDDSGRRVSGQQTPPVEAGFPHERKQLDDNSALENSAEKFVSCSGTLDSGGSPGFVKSPGLDASLFEAFKRFCAFGSRKNLQRMDRPTLLKLCKDCQLLNGKLTPSIVEITFVTVASPAAKYISFSQFRQALQYFAERKEQSFEALARRIAESDGPLSNDSDSKPEWWNNKFVDEGQEWWRQELCLKPHSARRSRRLSDFDGTRSGILLREVPELAAKPPISPNTPLELDQLGEPPSEESSEPEEGSTGYWRDVSTENVRRMYMTYCLRDPARSAADARAEALRRGELKVVGGMMVEAPGCGLMDGASFSKICRDSGLFDARFTSGEADAMFAVACGKGPRKICFNQFVDLIQKIAIRKCLPEEELYLRIVSGNGPYARELSSGALGAGIGPGAEPNYAKPIGRPRGRPVFLRSSSAGPRRTSMWPSLPGPGALPPHPRLPPGGTSRGSGELGSGSEDAPGSRAAASAPPPDLARLAKRVERTFSCYCALKATWELAPKAPAIDNATYVRLVRECNLIQPPLTVGMVDNIFAKAKQKGTRKLGLREFAASLALIAAEKGCPVEEVVEAVSAKGKPDVSGTLPDSVRLYDDKAGYTGMYAAQHGLRRLRTRRQSLPDSQSGGEDMSILALRYECSIDPSASRSLRRVFNDLCSPESGQSDAAEQLMDNWTFAKVCNEVQLMDMRFSAADLIFASVKSQNARRINYLQFTDALRIIAKRHGQSLNSVVQRLIEHYAARGLQEGSAQTPSVPGQHSNRDI